MADTVIGRVSVKITPDTNGFERTLRQELREATANVVAQINVEFDTKALNEQAKKAKDQLEDKLNNVEADVSTQLNQFSLRRSMARLAILARSRFVELIPRVNEAAAAKAASIISALSGLRSIKSIGTDFADWLGNLDKSLPKVTALTLAVINLGSYLMTAASNVLTFGASLATTFQASLALPGILGGMALGFGATFAVLKDFNKVLPQVGKEFHKLQDSMSEKFWAKAKKPIQDFIDNLLPEFSRGMERTSSALGVFFSRLASTGSDVFKGELIGMFDDLQKSIRIASKHARSFMGIFEKLGSLGARQLPELAKWFGEISDQFNNWLGVKEASGELQGFVDRGVAALQDLGGVLRQTGRTFAGLSRAMEAAGGSTLQSMALTMKSVADTVNSPRFQKSMTTAFQGAHEGMSAIARQSGPAFQSLMIRLSGLLGDVLPTAGRTVGKAFGAIFKALDRDKVSSTLQNTFEGIENAIDDLVPAIGPLVDGLSGIVRVATELTQSIARTLSPIITKLGPKVESLADDITPLVKTMGELVSVVASFASGAIASIPNSLLLMGAAMLAFRRGSDSARTSLLGVSRATIDQERAFRSYRPTLRTLGTAMAFAMHSSDSLRKSVESGSNIAATSAQKALNARQSISSWARSMSGAAGQAAGMALMVSGASDKLGITGAVMGGMIGSTLGPWGAAVGAITGLISDFNAKLDSGRKAVRSLNDALSDHPTSFVANQRLINNTLDDFAQREKKLEGFDIKQALNADAWDLLKVSIFGGTTALEKNQAAVEKAQLAQDAFKTGVSQLAAAINGKCAQSLKDLNLTIDRVQPAMDNLGITWQEFQDSATAGGKSFQTMLQQITAESLALDTSKGRIANLGKAISDLDDPMRTTTSSAQALGSAMDAVFAPAVNAVQSTIAYKDALEQLRTKLGESVVSADLNTEAGRRTAEMVAQQITLMNSMIQARAAEGATGERIAQMYYNQRQAILASAGADQQKRAAVEQLLAKMNLTPEFIVTQFQTAGVEPTKEQLRTLGVQMDDLNKKPVTLKAAATSIAGAIGGILGTAKKGSASAAAEITKAMETKTATVKLDKFKSSVTKGVGAAGKAGAARAKEAGHWISSGLAGGMYAGLGAVTAAANALVAQADRAIRAKAEIHSPSRLTQRLGKYLTAGFVKGIVGDKNHVRDAYAGLIDLLNKSGRKKLANFVKTQRDELMKLASQWEKISARIAQVQAYVDQVKNNIAQTGSPVEMNGGSFIDIVANLTHARDAARQFAAALAKLRDLKLNKTTMDQLAQAGPEAALAAAQAIVASGQAGVNQINTLQNQLNNAANAAGNAAADVMFANGQNIVKGLLAGLKAQRKNIEIEMRGIAQIIVQVIKKQLGIKSPSRVFKKLGGHVGEGFVLGIDSERRNADKAIKRLSAGRPRIPSYAAAGYGSTGSTVANKTINYYAAAGKSISSEEELFAAMARARSA